MIRKTKKQEKRSAEDIISMILGLVIILILGLLIFKFFERNKGKIDIPGISLKRDETIEENKTEENVIKVAEGQTLWQIAEDKYGDGFKWSEIAKANEIENPDKIESGQELVLPQIEEKEIEKTPEEYTVTAGDSLWKIAVRFYNDGYQWTKIWQNNREKLNNPNQMEIGMKLAL